MANNRTGSLIVTLFGDSIAPRGGVVWIGSLIQALAPLGISQRLVRTAVFRLVQDGILTNEQIGRRSYYTLTEEGREQFDTATAKIYAQPQAEWDGSWCIVLLSNVPNPQRAVVRQALSWLGFGQFGADTLAHPRTDWQRLQTQLAKLGVGEDLVLFEAGLPPTVSAGSLRRLVSQTWGLQALEQAYGDYLKLFEPILAALQQGQPLRDDDAFYIRSFMIHEYRKVVLRDPALPAELLPEHWPGRAAYTLSRDLYRRVLSASEQFIDNHFISREGALSPLSPGFAARFGGLADLLEQGDD